jgi:hypothetical protein
MPRLRPGFRNANSACFRVVSGPNVGRVGLGDPIEGFPHFNLRSRNAAGAVEQFDVNRQDVEEINKAECAGIPLGQVVGGRRKHSRKASRKGSRKGSQKGASRRASRRKGRRGY